MELADIKPKLRQDDDWIVTIQLRTQVAPSMLEETIKSFQPYFRRQVMVGLEAVQQVIPGTGEVVE